MPCHATFPSHEAMMKTMMPVLLTAMMRLSFVDPCITLAFKTAARRALGCRCNVFVLFSLDSHPGAASLPSQIRSNAA